MDTSQGTPNQEFAFTSHGAKGRELVRRVMGSANQSAAPSSGFGSASDFKKRCDSGFYAHLSKPLDLRLLGAAIQRALQAARAESAASGSLPQGRGNDDFSAKEGHGD